jgi:myosin heavy subunit
MFLSCFLFIFFDSINFANEKLQQHFTFYIIDMEQQEYKDEGVPFNKVDYEDNRDCIELIEGKLGIFQYIEEEGVIPKGTNQTLLKKLGDNFSSSRFEISKKIASGFCVRHYAGAVHYSIEGFIQKNKDNFHQSLLTCVLESKIGIIASIFEEDISNLSSDSSSEGRIRKSTTGNSPAAKKGAKIRSVGTHVSFFPEFSI